MSEMRYISTRGGMDPIGFQDAVMCGLAPDGGLIIPASIPNISDKLDAWSELSYCDLAFEVTRLYTDMPEDDLRSIINKAYSTFRHPNVCPTVKAGPVHILELFHGPTLAFKDVALQWLGGLFEYILGKRGGHINILAATSGDTGSAAIHGVRGKDGITIFVMHPKGRVSPTQEKQMTSVLDDNVFNLAVEGTFDDCQTIMKNIFCDVEFKKEHAMGAVNSVNWARVLAQIVYYFYAGLQMRKTGTDNLRFSVPTGNFGDVLAGWYAKQMGLPVEELILATNENDILSRFFNSGVYSAADVVPTLSPSMDIQVASNFERYLYYLLDCDADKLRTAMNDFEENGRLSVPLTDGKVDPLFSAGVGNTASTMEVIKRYQKEYGYLLDPHTAVGVSVSEKLGLDGAPVICLATAHPAKFGQAIIDATGEDLGHHPILDALEDAETHCSDIAADEQTIAQYVADHT